MVRLSFFALDFQIYDVTTNGLLKMEKDHIVTKTSILIDLLCFYFLFLFFKKADMRFPSWTRLNPKISIRTVKI